MPYSQAGVCCVTLLPRTLPTSHTSSGGRTSWPFLFRLAPLYALVLPSSTAIADEADGSRGVTSRSVAHRRCSTPLDINAGALFYHIIALHVREQCQPSRLMNA
jgi:hypothetical protein